MTADIPAPARAGGDTQPRALATDTAVSARAGCDTHGRAQAVTVVLPVRRWWAAWLRGTWPGADRLAVLKRPLVRLSFIHVAHWGLAARVPGADGRRLPHPYLIFNTNYNDDLDAYIDAFAKIVPWRMRLMWHGAYGYPGLRSAERFTSFVRARAAPVQHYYCGYPDGSARSITQALALREEHRRLADAAAGMSEREFAAEWERFVERNQLAL